MAEVFLYADETGNLDYEGEGKNGASTYFGFGTAVFVGDHADALFGGMKLRAEISSSGIYLPEGFHAVNDKIDTKHRVFNLIKEQAPRFDSTFLYKAAAYDSVKRKGQNYLYKMAWYLHLKEVAIQVSNRGDTLYVVAGTFGTAARQTAAKMALEDVCSQINRDIRLCVWKSSSSWGLQVADYGLWAIQRRLEGKNCSWLAPCIQPTLKTEFHPWGRQAVLPKV